MFRGIRLIAFLVVLTLVATACGGGEEAEGDATTTSASGSGGDGAAATTTTKSEPVSGDSGSTYCDRIRATQVGDEQGLDFNFLNLNPDEIKAQFERNLRVFEDWQSIAPDEIKDDAAVLVETFRAIVERGNELEWDIEALIDDDVFNGFDDAAVAAASDNLDAYSLNVCGVDTSISGEDGPPPDDGGDNTVGSLLGALGIPIPTEFLSEEDLECLNTALEPLLSADIGPGYIPTGADIEVLSKALDTCELG